MTASLSPALPGFSPTRVPSEQLASSSKSERASFDKMVRGTENPSTPESRRATHEAGPHDPRWAKSNSAGLDKGEPAHNAQGKTASPKLPAGKTAKDDADTDPDKAAADAKQIGQDAHASPLQDHLPLLMALHDMQRFPTPAKTDRDNAATGETERDSVLDGQPFSPEPLFLSPTKSRSASVANADILEAKSRSERASTAADLSGQKLGRQPEIGPAFDAPLHQDDLASLLRKEHAATDASTPEPKRPASVISGPETAQTFARSEPGKQALSVGRVDVVAEQSFPAPAQNPMSQTASVLVEALASDSGLRQALSTPSVPSQMTPSVAVPTHMLKIELHPAELGMVTASLRLAGEQLSIELKPETHEAYRRLASDSEAIVKSLRGLGFDVDKVTILQPSIAVTAATRTDASSALPTSPGRDQPSFQPGNSGGGNAGSGGQQPGRNPHNDAQEFGRTASPSVDRAGDDMFI